MHSFIDAALTKELNLDYILTVIDELLNRLNGPDGPEKDAEVAALLYVFEALYQKGPAALPPEKRRKIREQISKANEQLIIEALIANGIRSTIADELPCSLLFTLSKCYDQASLIGICEILKLYNPAYSSQAVFQALVGIKNHADINTNRTREAILSTGLLPLIEEFARGEDEMMATDERVEEIAERLLNQLPSP